MDDDRKHELDQAELLMRMVKAQIRDRQENREPMGENIRAEVRLLMHDS